MRIGGEPTAFSKLTTKVREALGWQAPFEECTGVDTRCRVGLNMQLVRSTAPLTATEIVVEPDFEERSRGQIGRYVAADARAGIVRLQHHGRGVPAHEVLDARFQFNVAGVSRLGLHGDGVDVRGVERRLRNNKAAAGSVLLERPEQITRAALAARLVQRIEGVEPLLELISPGRINGGLHGAALSLGASLDEDYRHRRGRGPRWRVALATCYTSAPTGAPPFGSRASVRKERCHGRSDD